MAVATIVTPGFIIGVPKEETEPKGLLLSIISVAGCPTGTSSISSSFLLHRRGATTRRDTSGFRDIFAIRLRSCSCLFNRRLTFRSNRLFRQPPNRVARSGHMLGVISFAKQQEARSRRRDVCRASRAVGRAQGKTFLGRDLFDVVGLAGSRVCCLSEQRRLRSRAILRSGAIGK